MKYTPLVTAFLFLLLHTATLSAQDTNSEEEIAKQYRVQSQKLENERVEKERIAIREQVERLASQAAALRGEFNFEEAARVEAEIRSLCWNYDPRVIRANDLKRRAAAARLSGKTLDADMFEREADRVLHDLKQEYASDEEPLLPANRDNRSTDDSRLVEEISTLRAQMVDLTNEMFRLKGELSKREQQLSHLNRR